MPRSISECSRYFWHKEQKDLQQSLSRFHRDSLMLFRRETTTVTFGVDTVLRLHTGLGFPTYGGLEVQSIINRLIKKI